MNEWWLNSSVVDPLNNPYFGTAGENTLGSGTGWGFYDWSGVPGSEAFINQATGNGDNLQDASINAQALSDWLAQNGYSLRQASQGEEDIRYLTDANGNIIGAPQSYSREDEKFWTAALLASAVAGSAIAGWSGAGAAAGEAGAAGTAGTAGATGASAGTGAATGAGEVLGSWGGWNVDPSMLGSAMSTGGGDLNTWLQLGGALYGNYSNNKAADAANAGLESSNALQKYMYDQTRADYQRYRQAGYDALSQIQGLLSDPSAITKQADYQFGLQQGTNALNSGAASRGMTYSGAQQKALQRYGQDYAGTKLNESYNRLAGIAGIGQQATGSTTAAGSNYANNVGNALQTAGNNQAGAYVGNAQNWMNAFGNIANYNQQKNLLWGNGG
jgi:hypothetical protein